MLPSKLKLVKQNEIHTFDASREKEIAEFEKTCTPPVYPRTSLQETHFKKSIILHERIWAALARLLQHYKRKLEGSDIRVGFEHAWRGWFAIGFAENNSLPAVAHTPARTKRHDWGFRNSRIVKNFHRNF